MKTTFLLFGQLFFLWGCNNIHSTLDNVDGTSQGLLERIRSSHNYYVYDKTHRTDYLFDQNTLRRYDLYLKEADLAFLDENPVREQYVDGALVFEDERLDVGIRYKGAHGSFEGFLEDFGNGGGPKIASKLSMTVKINWKSKGDKFYGVKKLQFHSMYHDRGMLRERLYWWLLKEFGNLTPRAMHAKLYINGTYAGVYALTEQIDGRYTDEHFTPEVLHPLLDSWSLQIEEAVIEAAALYSDVPTLAQQQESVTCLNEKVTDFDRHNPPGAVW